MGEHCCSYLNSKESSFQVVHKGLLLCPHQATENEDKELKGSHLKDRRRLPRNSECVSMCVWQAEWKSPHAEALSWLECLEKEQNERRSLKHLEQLFLWRAELPPAPFLVKHYQKTTNDQTIFYYSYYIMTHICDLILNINIYSLFLKGSKHKWIEG